MATSAITIHAYFLAFQSIAREWFLDRDEDIQSRLAFFQDLRNPNWFSTAKWEDFQKLGDHLLAFRNHPLARKRALGNQNHKLSIYRTSFLTLLFSKDPLSDRLDQFIRNVRGFHLSASSELLFMVFPDQYICANQQNICALEKLSYSLPPIPKSRPGKKLLSVQIVMGSLARQYQKSIGKLTPYPLNIEIDQFLAFVNDKYDIQIEEWAEPIITEGIGLTDKDKISISVKGHSSHKVEMPVPHQAPKNAKVVHDLDQIIEESFVEPSWWKNVLEVLNYKKNIILKGPPGVGKSFLARKLAHVITGSNDSEKDTILSLQLHMNYSYEDLMLGYRPEEGGLFSIKKGSLYTFCEQAMAEPELKFVCIIEEMNRADLGNVLGEMLQLLEADKRGPNFAMTLTYATDYQDTFYVPENVYIIGTMNTVDRSVQPMDAALKRRFSFFPVEAYFGPKFLHFLTQKGVSAEMSKHIAEKMEALNTFLAQSSQLNGKNIQIGHSYFLQMPDNMNAALEKEWLQRIVAYDIQPMMEMYLADHESIHHSLLADLMAIPEDSHL